MPLMREGLDAPPPPAVQTREGVTQQSLALARTRPGALAERQSVAAERRPSVERSRPAATAAAFQDGHGGAYGAVGPLRGRPPSTAHYLQLTPAGCGQPLGPPPNVQVGGAWTGSGAGASTVEDGGGGAGAAGGERHIIVPSRGSSAGALRHAPQPPAPPIDDLRPPGERPHGSASPPAFRAQALSPKRASFSVGKAGYVRPVPVGRTGIESHLLSLYGQGKLKPPGGPASAFVERTLLSTFPAQAATLSALKPTPLAAYVLPSRSADEAQPQLRSSVSTAAAAANAGRQPQTAGGVVTDAGVRLAEPTSGGIVDAFHDVRPLARPTTAGAAPTSYTPRSIKVARVHPSQRPLSSSGALQGPFAGAQFLRTTPAHQAQPLPPPSTSGEGA